jgi:hypothetical protein
VYVCGSNKSQSSDVFLVIHFNVRTLYSALEISQFLEFDVRRFKNKINSCSSTSIIRHSAKMAGVWRYSNVLSSRGYRHQDQVAPLSQHLPAPDEFGGALISKPSGEPKVPSLIQLAVKASAAAFRVLPHDECLAAIEAVCYKSRIFRVI